MCLLNTEIHFVLQTYTIKCRETEYLLAALKNMLRIETTYAVSFIHIHVHAHNIHVGLSSYVHPDIGKAEDACTYMYAKSV